MKDLVTRLRGVELHPEWYGKLVGDAADAIEAQQAALVKCHDALTAVPALINHQYTGTSEAMSTLQDASDQCEAAIAEAERVIG